MGSRLLLAVVVVAIAVAALVLALARSDGTGDTPAVAPTRLADGEPRLGEPAQLVSPLDAVDQPSPIDLRGSSSQQPSERRAARSLPPGSETLRGRVVDERTGQGLPAIEVARLVEPRPLGESIASRARAHGEAMHTDADGRFASRGAVQSGRIALEATDQLTGEELGSLEHEHRPVAQGAGPAQLVWPVDVGPTLVVRLIGGEGGEEPWRLRLVELDEGGRRHAWSWIEARAGTSGGELLARYARVEREPDAELLAGLEVTDARGLLSGEVRLPTLLGVHDLEVPIVPVAASLTGRVIDEDGVAIGAAVFALARGAAEEAAASWPTATTDETGRYRFDGLEPGPIRLLVASDHRALARADLDLITGERRELDFTLASLRVAGDVRGELVGPLGGDEPVGVVRLVSADGGATDLLEFCFELHVFDSNEDERSPFAFEGLPEGRYRLELLALDGRTYAPATLVVSPPEPAAVFVTDEPTGVDEKVRLRLRVLDRASGARLGGYSWLPRVGPYWAEEIARGDVEGERLPFPMGVPIELLVTRPGYRPAFETLTDATPEGDEMVLEVELEPGWGCALLVLDASRMMGGREARFDEIVPMLGLAGARVSAGGQIVGMSDASGLALCTSDAPIEAFDVTLPGWSVLAVRRFRGQTRTPDGIGWVLMAPG